MGHKIEVRKTTREQRREETLAALAAEEAKNGKEKSAEHQKINNGVRKFYSVSDEIAILRHTVVVLADALIQAKVLNEKNVEELLEWNNVATKVKHKVKTALPKGE